MMQLSGREKKMVTLAGIALAVFVVVQFMIYPLIDQRARLRKRLVSKENALFV